MAWYSLYTLPASGTALPSGWTDVGGVWTSQTASGGRVLQVTDTTATAPWQNRQLVRKTANEASQNTRVQIRWSTSSGAIGAAPFTYSRYVPNTTDATANGYAVKTNQLIPIVSGGLGASVTPGTNPTLTANAWYDTQVDITTSGSNVTVVEKTWTVADPFSDAFGAGTAVTNSTFATQTAYPSISGGEGVFAYQPGTLNIAQFNTFSDAAASSLALSPGNPSGSAGAAISFTVTANAAQNGGTVSISDGGAGGTFSATTVTLAAGAGASGTFTYTPASGSAGTNVTITASSSALTGSAITGTATVAVAAGPATALTLSPSSQSVVAGSASSTITCAANGTLSTSKTVTLSDGGAGGTFSPTSLTLSSGSTSGTFTYTPATGATGAITLTAATSGLTSGTATVTATAPPAVLTPGGTAMTFSPYNWVTGLANTSVTGNTAVRCWNPGAYFRAYVSGCTTVSVLFGTSNTSATFTYAIDGGLPSSAIACLSGSGYSITLPDTGAHIVTWTLQTLPQATGRWAGTNAVVINGVQLGSGGAAGTAIAGSRLLLIYGDSITEGTQSRDGSDGANTGYAYAVGEAFRRLGWEYGIRGAANSGLAWATPSSSGGQPVAWTSGNDTLSSYNKVDGSGAAGAALTTGTAGGASERFVQQPSLIIEAWGTNDSLNSVSTATVQSTLTGLMQQLRVCAPNAIILKLQPFGGYLRSAIAAGISGLADARTILIDPKVDSFMTATAYCGNLLTGASSSQSIHPWSVGSAKLGALVAGAALAAYTPFATARSSGSVS